ncbi:hypothetical protein V5O48_002524 [Marasmius crinis-equi]|uniref:Uncharacterized protein n=1 Tax=Marasmius crinis-equi TaxID=585013 RepID=A0ABR3FVF5_9AGAR
MGRSKVFTIDQGQGGTQSDVQIPELNLLSLAFAPLQLESPRYVLSITSTQLLERQSQQQVSLGLDIPRKITHVPSLKVFGVATDRVEPYRVGDKTPGSFKLLDDSTSEEVARFRYEKN